MEKKQVKRTKKMNSEEDRLVSFSKRRSGIYKKASELSTLCSAEVGIVIFSPNGKPFSFGHPCMETITEKVLSQKNMNTVVPCDHNAENFLEAYRRVRINELHQNYKEACKQMKAAKDQEKKIKKKNLSVRPNKGWWEEPIIVLDMDGLRHRADLIQKLYNHVHLQIAKLQSMAATAPYSTLPSSHTTQAVGHGRRRQC